MHPIYFALNAATTLTSSVDGRRSACPGEGVTYTCTVLRGRTLEWTAKPFIIHNNRLQFSSTAPPGDRVLDCSDPTSPVLCADFDYQATLTIVSTLRHGFADMTSTFRFTASARVNGTVVQCKGLTVTEDQMASHTLNVTGAIYILSVYLKLHDIFMGVHDFEPKLSLPNNYCSTASSFGLFSPML